MWLRKICRLAVLSLAISPIQAFSAASPHAAASTTTTVDKVLVLKGERKLMLLQGEQVLKTYTVSLGANPVGPKMLEGDRKTPEGLYVLDRHNPHSQYHRSIHISYPNETDLNRVKKFGFPTGGELYIHGLPNDYNGPTEGLGDWTNDCIAVTNAEIDEIWRMVPDGTPIEIKP